jgi:hypothetical protein
VGVTLGHDERSTVVWESAQDDQAFRTDHKVEVWEALQLGSKLKRKSRRIEVDRKGEAAEEQVRL